jgi:hypothetical protein
MEETMDTQDRFPPRDTELEAAGGDVGVNPDAEFNPDAVVDDPGGHAAPAEGYGDESASEPLLKRWQIIGLVAGGLAVAAGVGVAGVVYWRLTQAQRPENVLSRMRPSGIDLSKAHPRRLSQMAGQRIRQLPVRQMQKRLADRVSHLFG